MLCWCKLLLWLRMFILLYPSLGVYFPCIKILNTENQSKNTSNSCSFSLNPIIFKTVDKGNMSRLPITDLPCVLTVPKTSRLLDQKLDPRQILSYKLNTFTLFIMWIKTWKHILRYEINSKPLFYPYIYLETLLTPTTFYVKLLTNFLWLDF